MSSSRTPSSLSPRTGRPGAASASTSGPVSPSSYPAARGLARGDVAGVLEALPAPPPPAAQVHTGPIRSPGPQPSPPEPVDEMHPLHPGYVSTSSPFSPISRGATGPTVSVSSSEFRDPPIYDDPLRMPQRPWAGGSLETLPSRPSSEYAASVRSEGSENDLSRLTADTRGSTLPEAPIGLGLPAGRGTHSRSPSRPYDSEGRARAGALGIITRSPTIRRVSASFRNASIRVANILGNEKEGYEGLTRLSTNEDSPLEMSSPPSTPPTPPDPPSPPPPPPRPPPVVGPNGLRGRTLGVFSATNPLRIAMDRLLLFPWTDPIILVLIMANVVVLTFQAAPPLFEPRSPGGTYFRGWEDYALFALFSVFTVEMFARIVVSGLILDPETSISTFFRRAWDYSMFYARADVDPATHQAQKEAWHLGKKTTTTHSSRFNTRQVMLSEAPFQEAVMRQRGLMLDNRPYLRHSWYRIDMVAVVAFWISFILAMTGQEVTDTHHLYLFRAMSILRTTRLLVITSGTATILHSLKRAGPLLLNVSTFIVFAAALFSIIGVQSFRGSLRRTCILTDPFNPDSEGIKLNTCGGWLNPITLLNEHYLKEDGTPSSLAPKGFICPLNQVCQTNNESLNNDSESFDNIFKSLIQVLIIAGVNTWTSTMYETMDSDYFSSTLFFLVAIIVLNFWLMNLLVAVVVNTFQDIRADTKKSAFGADSSLLAEPDWAQGTTKKPKEASRLFKWYRKTELFWCLLIVVDLIAQATKSDESSAEELRLLRNMEIAFAMVWITEMVIRMAAYTPDWRTFVKSFRNDFDLFLAVSCGIIQIPPIRNSSIYPWLTVFQLLRWYRVILIVPRMKPLLINIFGSFAGLLNMVFFLFLMTFLAALMAVQFLRGDLPSGEEMIDFSQAYNAFIGMYQIFSTENWTTVLYNALAAEWSWDQGWIVCIFLFIWFLFANFIMMQMFIAVINENFAVAEEQKRKQQIESFIRKTEPVSAHVSWIERLNPYRLIKGRQKAVRADSVPQNLILPLKQTIGQDVGAPDVDEDEATGKAAIKRLFGIAEDGMGKPIKGMFKKKRPHSTQRHSTNMGHRDDDSDDDRGLTDLLPPINPGPSVDEHKDALREQRNQQADFIQAHPSYDKSLWLFSQKSRVRQFCQMLTAPAHGQRIFGRPAHPVWSFLFKVLVFFAVVASIVIAAISTPAYRKRYYQEYGLIRGWFTITEAGIAAIFFAEAVIKIIADGFMFAPNAYLLSVWNVVDFIILLALLVNSVSALIVVGGVNRATRALKAFRALRLITLFSRLRDTFHVVFFAGFVRILDALVLMILYLIPFAVWGLNIFSRRLTSCNDGGDNIRTRSDCVAEYMAAPIDDSLGFLAPRAWANPTFDGSIWSFDDFRSSFLILFEIVSLEGWTDAMSSAMNIVGLDQQPRTNNSQWNSIFFIIFNLFGAIIILTVFLAIIIENFSISAGTALLTAEQRQWVDLKKYIRQQTPSLLPKKKPRSPLRLWCYRRATTKRGYWQRFFTFLYFVHIFLLMTEDYSNNIMSESQLDLTFLVLTVLYAVDLVVRFIGLGPKSFRSNGWNLFDVVVVAGSFATTIPALQASASGVEGNQASKQVQKLFLVAVALKLVQRLDALNQLFKTSVASLPAIGNLFLLWAVLFIFATIVYMEVFGLTKMGPSANSRFQNYHTFRNSLIMLAFMSTGEGWNGYMHDYTVEYPRCTEGAHYLESDCGSVGWAYSLFISWNILSMYIFLNMFTGVVVQSFSYVYQMPGSATLDREQMRSFKQAWAQIDVNRTGYIRRKDVVRFFSMLHGVFEVRLYPSEYSVQSLLRSSVPAPGTTRGVERGVRQAVDLSKLRREIAQIDYEKVKARRRQFVRLFYEAKITEEARGISFTNMLLMLSHATLINDEDALQVDELLVRRAKMERVDDLVNLDRVRGLLRTIYWRGRFKEHLAEKARAAAADAGYAVPAIVLPGSEPKSPRTPSLHDQPLQPDRSPWGTPTHTPPSSRPGSPGASPLASPGPSSPSRWPAPRRQGTGGSSNSPTSPKPRRQGTAGSGSTESQSRQGTLELPADSVDGHFTLGSASQQSHSTMVVPGGASSRLSHTTLGPSRRGSTDSATLSLSQGHLSRLSSVYSGSVHSREPSFDEPSEDVLAAMATSVWGDMMREAVENEDGDSQ